MCVFTQTLKRTVSCGGWEENGFLDKGNTQELSFLVWLEFEFSKSNK